MTIRDLGYRPYEGTRLPPSSNTRVLFRHALSRAWASWLMKIAVFLCWLPTIVMMAYWWFGIITARQSAAAQVAMLQARGIEIPPLTVADVGGVMQSLLGAQLWFFVTFATLGAGAGAISQDLSQKAFQFYFAKPVTSLQYIAARLAAVSVWVFVMTAVPALLLGVVMVGTVHFVDPELRLGAGGVLVGGLIQSALIALTCATASVGVSSTSKSRALTMTSWLVLFIVPHVLAWIVDKVSDWDGLYLLSIPRLLTIVGDALMRVAPEGDLRWFHALPMIAALIGASLYLTNRRVQSAEVIT